MLNRNEILGKDDQHRMKLEIPEWDGFVYVRSMSLAERNKFFTGHRDEDSAAASARLAVACVCDEAGAPLFKPEDAEVLVAKNAAAMQRIQAAAFELNGLGLAVQEVKKN